MSTKDLKRMRAFLESRGFYELAQLYRHAPAVKPQGVVDAFERIKHALLDVMEGRTPHIPEADEE